MDGLSLQLPSQLTRYSYTAMAQPKPTLLTIPLELRRKIYGYAIEPGEFQVCECPEACCNKLGLCDLIKAHHASKTQGSWSTRCHTTRSAREIYQTLRQTPKSLRLLCKQTSEELKDVNTRLTVLPVLIFCTPLCCTNFWVGLVTREWPMKIKTSADPQYDVDGTYTAWAEKRLNRLYEDPMFLRKMDGMTVVARKDSGQLHLGNRTVEAYLEGSQMRNSCRRQVEEAAAASTQ